MLQNTLDALATLAILYSKFTDVNLSDEANRGVLLGFLRQQDPEHNMESVRESLGRARECVAADRASGQEALASVITKAIEVLDHEPQANRRAMFESILRLWPLSEPHREDQTGLHFIGLAFGLELAEADAILQSIEGDEAGPGHGAERAGAPAEAERQQTGERPARSQQPDPGLLVLQPTSGDARCRIALLAAYPSIGLDLASARIPFLRQVVIKNESPEPMSGARIKGRLFAPQFDEPLLEFEADLPSLEPGERRVFDGPLSVLNYRLLLRVDTAVPARVEIDLDVDGSLESHRNSEDLRILAHDQWAGFEQSSIDSGIGELLLAMLACHVQHQDPAVERIRLRASEILESRTGKSSQEGYQSGPERAKQIAGGIFDALVGVEINYSNPPASSETLQRIRTPSQIVESKFGTCMDTACLFSACLEQAGLNPVLVVIEGHAFVGIHLEDGSLRNAVTRDASLVNSLVDAGQLLLIETTAITQGHSREFEAAIKEGKQRLIHSPLSGIVDVRAARREGLGPIPARVVDEHGQVQIIENSGAAASTVVIGGERVVSKDPVTLGPVPARVQKWQAELLDLSLRNPLLNLRLGGRATGIRLITPEDAAPVIDEILVKGNELLFSAHDQLTEVQRQRGARVAADLAEEDLRTCLHNSLVFVEAAEEKLVATLKKLKNKARAVEEESGANILHLTLGTVVWKDPDKKREVRSPFLLIPVRLMTGGRGRPPRLVIDRTSDGTVINYCLMEKLRHAFRLSVPALDSWSNADESGGVEEAFQAFREAVVKNGLSIQLEPSCALALLHFGKFRMWRDLRDHWKEFMEASGFVKHIIENPGQSYEQEAQHPTPQEVEEAEAYCPVPYDGAQLEAIVAAAKGCSFVLEGPPGTGKSQTITNLVAHALAEGHRVLFVAEKRAALDVVKGRLRKVGLGPFCLDIHDKKSTPKGLREQLLASLNFHVDADGERYQAVRSTTSVLANELRQYSSDLHQPNAAGYSLWDAHQACLRWTDEQVVELPSDVVEKTGSRLSSVEGLCTELMADARASGFGDGSPWILSRLTDLEPNVSRVAERLAALVAVFGTDTHLGESTDEDVGAGGPRTPRALELAEVLERAAEGPDPGVRPTDRAQAQELYAIADEVAALELALETREVIDQGIALEKIMSAIQGIEEARGAFFLFRKGRIAKALARARAETYLDLEGAELMHRALKAAAADLKRLGASKRRLEALGATISVELSSAAARDSLVAGLRWHALKVLDEPETIALAEALADQPQERLKALHEFHGRWVAFCQALDADEESLRRWCGPVSILSRVRECLPKWEGDGVEGRFLMLGRWCRFHAGLGDLHDLGLGALADGVLGGSIAIEDLPGCAVATIARASRSERLGAMGLLRFDGERHSRKADEFAGLIAEEAELLLQQLPVKLLGTRPFQPGRLTGTIGELHRVELKRKRGGRTIRALLRDYSDAIAALTPCVLASPDSVAQYLEPGSMSFDLVVFDEASQVTVANAVGAMGRGKAVVVVGDSKQMPPTSFFSRGAAVQNDEEDDPEKGQEVVADDLESILEECVGSGLQRVWLSWHYRSEVESLIAFSNEHYYEDRLSSFPAPGGRPVSLGITWHKVEDGQFLTGAERTNPREADSIVVEVRRRLNDPLEKGRSIGVVALNLQQADLIREKLEAECANDIELARAMEDETESGIFVKNLENVQGDERDVIMISVTYAPSPSGAMRMQFGPLGQAGGERRWNVLVTRAKQEVVVFSSIEPEDIKLERVSATARGVHHMRSYLELARDGVEVARERAMRPVKALDHHRGAIGAALRRHGLLVQESVGLSSFKVDLAVGHPENPEEWLVAILLDGPGYQARATVRDRDALPKQVLGALMKWPVVTRVWLPEWLAEPERVATEVVRHVEAAREKSRAARERAELAVAIAAPTGEDWSSSAPLPAEIPRMRPATEEAQAFVRSALDERVDVRSAASSIQDEGAVEPLSVEVPPLVVERDPRELDFQAYEPLDQVGDADDLKDPLAPNVALRVKAAIRAVLEKEGPVEEERLGKLVANTFGIQRVRADRVKVVLGQVPTAQRRTSQLGAFVWPPNLNPDSWLEFRRQQSGQPGVRTIEEISPEEVRNALVYLVETGVGISRSDAVADLAEIFGIKRVSKGIRARLESIIDLCVETHACLNVDGRMSLSP